MKIGVNTLFFIPKEVGGTETYLTEVLREMATLSGPDQFILFTNRENDGHLRRLLSAYPNVSFHCLPVRAMNRYARILAEQTILPLKVAQAAVDILWSPGYTAPFFVFCPQVVTIHDMQYKRYPEDFGVIARWTTALLVSMAIRRCRRIITCVGIFRSGNYPFYRCETGKDPCYPCGCIIDLFSTSIGR